MYYRIQQAKKTEDEIRIDGEKILTLYQDGLNEQKFFTIPRRYRFKVQELVIRLGMFLTVLWFLFCLFAVIRALA